ncbi:MAG: GAF domain-containing protein [Gudongella sp.]|nr:GAF domain-containing protein [Gudongella sp.]
MFKLENIYKMNEEERLKYMLLLLKGQLSSEKDNIANLSNASGIINACIERINWVGFYILKGNTLVLGPFQGLPACNRIEFGKGVCGTSIKEMKTMLVPDIELFPSHIACDSASKSELVVPIIQNNKVYGVLDLDSPEKNRFNELEKRYFEKYVDILNDFIRWDELI